MSDRRYRQTGYQDDDRPKQRGPQGPPPPRKEGPRGRGLGAPKNEVFRCRDCGTERPIAAVIVADSTCTNCGRPLHNCVNCLHFDTSARNECRKPIPARLPSKTKANTCELFAQKIAVESDGGKSDSPKDPRAAFDALFR
jgi:hypothetical protein